jgi:aspartate/methionine/tyrosine aminotransferase
LILDFSASINPLGPPKSAIAAIEQELKDLVAYPDPHYHQLRASLNQLHPTLSPDWILPGNGSAELLTWACRELSELEETFLVTPAFSDYRRALKAFDAKVREYRLLSQRRGEGTNNQLPYSLLPTPYSPLLFSRPTRDTKRQKVVVPSCLCHPMPNISNTLFSTGAGINVFR